MCGHLLFPFIKFAFNSFLTRLFHGYVILYIGKLKGGIMKKTNYLAKQKRTVYLLLIFILGCILVLSFFLNTYLLELQRKERLEKIGDYTNYELSYEPQKRCQLKEKFIFEDKTFYFDCVDEVYLSYGSTKMTLEEALKNKYLTFEDLTTGLFEEETDEEIFYEHDKTKTTQEYRFVVNKEKSTITFKGAIE